MKKVFMIGAGYVAGEAALRLIAKGHEVSIGKRQPEQGLPASLPSGTPVLRMDVLVPSSFPPAMFEADSLIYCVASAGFSPEQYRQAYYEGLSNVLARLQAQPSQVRRIIFVSSTGVFSQEEGARVDESSPAEPRAFSGQIMLDAETALKRFGEQHPHIETSAIRFSGIYGPGRTRMLKEALAGPPVTRKRWEQFTNRIHRDDCAAALVHLVEREKVRKTYVASDMAPSRFGEVISWLANKLQVAPPPILETAMDGNEQASKRTGLERGGHKQCWSTALLDEGFSFKYPSFREGYEALIISEFGGGI